MTFMPGTPCYSATTFSPLYGSANAIQHSSLLYPVLLCVFAHHPTNKYLINTSSPLLSFSAASGAALSLRVFFRYTTNQPLHFVYGAIIISGSVLSGFSVVAHIAHVCLLIMLIGGTNSLRCRNQSQVKRKCTLIRYGINQSMCHFAVLLLTRGRNIWASSNDSVATAITIN